MSGQDIQQGSARNADNREVLDKSADLGNVLANIPQNSLLSLGGIRGFGSPEHLIEGLIRHNPGPFTLVAADVSSSNFGAGKLIAAGLVEKLITSRLSDDEQLRCLIEERDLQTEIISQGMLAERIRVGAIGSAGILMPEHSTNTDNQSDNMFMVDGKAYHIEMPILADTALIRAFRGDKFGNLIFRKSESDFNPIMATAAQNVIVETSELFEIGDLNSEQIHTSGVFVDSIIETSRNYQ